MIVLKRFGLAYQPQLVVWQVFGGNDLTDAQTSRAGAPTLPPERPLKVRYWRKLPRSSLACNDEARGPSGGIEVAIAITMEHDTQGAPLSLRPRSDDTLPDAFAETEQAITAGIRLSESRGIRLAVLFLPTMVQVLEPFITFERSQDRERALPGGSLRSPRDFGSRLKAVCQKPACVYVDAFQALRARALVDNSRVFDRHDPDEHLDVDGHKAVARLIKDLIDDLIRSEERPTIPTALTSTSAVSGRKYDRLLRRPTEVRHGRRRVRLCSALVHCDRS